MTDSGTSKGGDPTEAVETPSGETAGDEVSRGQELHGWPVVPSHGQEVVHCQREG